jgi:hypothetical protein
MIKIISASADTYITNRIVSRHLRAKDANVGQAGTIDLFKLFNETDIVGEEEPIEITRALLKFDLEPIRRLTGSLFDPSSSSFKCKPECGERPCVQSFRPVMGCCPCHCSGAPQAATCSSCSKRATCRRT